MLDLAIALVICGTVALGITPWNKNSQQLKQIGNKDPLSHIQHVKNERQRLNSQDDRHPLSITFGGSNDRTPPLMLTHAPSSTTTTTTLNNQQLMLVPNPQQLSVALRSAPRSTTQRNTNFLFKIIGDSYFAKWLPICGHSGSSSKRKTEQCMDVEFVYPSSHASPRGIKRSAIEYQAMNEAISMTLNLLISHTTISAQHETERSLAEEHEFRYQL